MVVLRRKKWMDLDSDLLGVCFSWAHLPNGPSRKSDCRSLVVWSFLTNSTWNGSKKNFLERKHHDINYPFMDSIRIKNCIYNCIHICVYVYKDVSTTYLHIYIYLSRLTWIRTLLVNININYYHIKLAIQIYMSANSRRRYIWPNCNISPTVPFPGGPGHVRSQ